MNKKQKICLCISIVGIPVIVALLCVRKDYAHVHFVSGPKHLRINEPFTSELYPFSQLTVLDIDETGEKCLFELRDLKEREVLTGWVKVGDPISLPPEDKNIKRWAFLCEIGGEDTVSVEFHGGDLATTYGWRWRFWEQRW